MVLGGVMSATVRSVGASGASRTMRWVALPVAGKLVVT